MELQGKRSDDWCRFVDRLNSGLHFAETLESRIGQIRFSQLLKTFYGKEFSLFVTRTGSQHFGDVLQASIVVAGVEFRASLRHQKFDLGLFQAPPFWIAAMNQQDVFEGFCEVTRVDQAIGFLNQHVVKISNRFHIFTVQSIFRTISFHWLDDDPNGWVFFSLFDLRLHLW